MSSSSVRIDVPKWVQRFEEQWQNSPIEYRETPDGAWLTDDDPLFGSISAAIGLRGELTVEELQKISQWKMQGTRNDHNIQKNDPTVVVDRTQSALAVSDATEAIERLRELSGVGVPLASTVLTVAHPDEYAIIDYRAFRGLAAAKPELLNTEQTGPEGYAATAEFLEHFRTYLTNAEAYEYYLDHLRELATAASCSPREIDMALWAYDKMNG